MLHHPEYPDQELPEGTWATDSDPDSEPARLWVDAEGRILACTDATTDLLQRDPQELFAGRLSDLFEEPAPGALSRVLAGEPLLGTPARVRHRDGTLEKISGSWFARSPELIEAVLAPLPSAALRWQRSRELVAAVTHDLNNVLAPLLLRLPELRDLEPDDDDARLLDDLEAAVERAAGLLQSLEWIARSHAATPRPFPARIFAHELAKSLRRQGIESLEQEIRGDPPALGGDPAMLFRLFKSLGTEIASLGEDRSLTLTLAEIRDDPSLVELALDAPGVRMTAEEKSSLLDGSELPTSPHRSLIFAVRILGAVLSETGGGLEAVRCDEGLALRARLAAARPDPTEAVAPTPEAPKAAPEDVRGATVLVVDDEPNLRKVLERLLGRRGIETLTAADGRQALEILEREKQHIDLVLTDLSMPGLSGVRTVGEMRRIAPDLPILTMSGAAHERTQVADRFPDLVEGLRKPFRPAELLAAVSRLLQRDALSDGSDTRRS